MLVHLRGLDASLLLDCRGDGLPSVVHWGADLGPLDDDGLAAVARATSPATAPNALGHPYRFGLLPEAARGFTGTPGLSGHREGRDTTTRFELDRVVRSTPWAVELHARDPRAELGLVTELEMGTPVLRARHTLRNDGGTPYFVDALTVTLPVADSATELLDLTGRWCRERAPQRQHFDQGGWRREGRHGRTGHDATLLLVAGSAGFGFRHGEVWGVHLGWSGDHLSQAQRLPDGTAVLAAGELLASGEIVLSPGQTYTTPWVYGVWSGRGLDGLSAALHSWIRLRPTHPSTPRPVGLNTWEAVYLDHDPAALAELADLAAAVGVERFVLDDGWYRGRADERSGLGDWYVDERTWPAGLHPLVDRVRRLGMQFGLWVEPEMVSPASDLARDHPDWVLGHDRDPPMWRNQQVLDLTHPDAYAFILGRLHALLVEYDIGYLKWDHNRDLIDPVGHDGQPAVHRQTLAVYRLLDELRFRHPLVEVESCASGGGRVDLGILERTDRVWASDCNDALERQAIQRWTGLLLPPELVGAHVGPPVAETTGRTHTLSFRAATALFGHFGVEWDLRTATADERRELAAWVATYKELRPLLHQGEVVRVDHPDPAVWVHGVVAADRREALFAVVALATSESAVPGRVRPVGLDPEHGYAVTTVGTLPRTVQQAPPPWLADGVRLTGRTLMTAGVAVPVLAPESVLLLRLGEPLPQPRLRIG